MRLDWTKQVDEAATWRERHAFQLGAAVAFGLVGMAEAIRYRTRMFTCQIGDDYEVGYWSGWGDAMQDHFEQTTECPHGHGYIAECLECTEGPYPTDGLGEDKT